MNVNLPWWNFIGGAKLNLAQLAWNRPIKDKKPKKQTENWESTKNICVKIQNNWNFEEKSRKIIVRKKLVLYVFKTSYFFREIEAALTIRDLARISYWTHWNFWYDIK